MDKIFYSESNIKKQTNYLVKILKLQSTSEDYKKKLNMSEADLKKYDVLLPIVAKLQKNIISEY